MQINEIKISATEISREILSIIKSSDTSKKLELFQELYKNRINWFARIDGICLRYKNITSSYDPDLLASLTFMYNVLLEREIASDTILENKL